jgi:hypothetical protein
VFRAFVPIAALAALITALSLAGIFNIPRYCSLSEAMLVTCVSYRKSSCEVCSACSRPVHGSAVPIKNHIDNWHLTRHFAGLRGLENQSLNQDPFLNKASACSSTFTRKKRFMPDWTSCA